MQLRKMGSVPIYLLLVLFCAAAFAAEPKYRLSVDAPEREMRELLQRGLQLARWEGDGQMTVELLRRLAEEGLAEAREALAAQGYYSAQVSYTLDRDTTPWKLTIHVVPGPRTQVRSIEISFAGRGADDPEAERLRQAVRRGWLLRPGQPFTQEAWNEAKREAIREFAAWRYAGARLSASRARVDPEALSAELEVTIDSGPPYVFGELEVRGTERYKESLVSNLSPVQAGSTYDREVLVLYTRRLLATGYFAGGRAELAMDERGAGGAAPVRATVVEGSSQNIEGGLSFNTDAGLRLEATHRNVDMFDSAWRGRSLLRLDQLTQEARYDLDAPPRPGAKWWSGFAGARNSVIQQEENAELSAGVAHNWGGRGAPSAVIVSGHAEEQRIGGLAADHRHAVYFGFRFGFLDTDEVVLPRRGYFGQINVGGAPDALSTRGFHRGTARATLLYPLGRDDDLQVRAEGGIVVARSREGIPSTFLFRTGGDQTVRGYAFESIGVRQGDVVLGGRYLAIASAEYTHWFGPSWGLAAFIDAGSAWDTGDFAPVYGLGGGARFRTPIGPVRIDVAYGEAVESWRLHFSVGFVF